MCDFCSLIWVSNGQKRNNLLGVPLRIGRFQAWPENQAHDQRVTWVTVLSEDPLVGEWCFSFPERLAAVAGVPVVSEASSSWEMTSSTPSKTSWRGGPGFQKK